MKMHTGHSNLQFIVTSPSPFAMKLSLNVAHVSNCSPHISSAKQYSIRGTNALGGNLENFLLKAKDNK